MPQEYRQLEYLLSWHDGISRLFFILILSLSVDKLDDKVTPSLLQHINSLREFKSRFEAHLSTIDEVTKNIQKVLKIETFDEKFTFFQRLYMNLFCVNKALYLLESIYKSSKGHKQLCDELEKMLLVTIKNAGVLRMVMAFFVVKEQDGFFTAADTKKLDDFKTLSDLIHVTSDYMSEMEYMANNIALANKK